MMTQEQRNSMREEHQPMDDIGLGVYCTTCTATRWPCDATKALNDADEAHSEARFFHQMVEVMSQPRAAF